MPGSHYGTEHDTGLARARTGFSRTAIRDQETSLIGCFQRGKIYPKSRLPFSYFSGLGSPPHLALLLVTINQRSLFTGGPPASCFTMPPPLRCALESSGDGAL